MAPIVADTVRSEAERHSGRNQAPHGGGEASNPLACFQSLIDEGGERAREPILFHGLSQLGLPVVCIESRQAYQALKSLATHKTDRNDARGLAHLARTGFFKPVHVKSPSAHALRSLIIARKKLLGQRVTLENQIRGLAVAFGVFKWAEITPTMVASGRTGVRAKAAVPLRAPKTRPVTGQAAQECERTE